MKKFYLILIILLAISIYLFLEKDEQSAKFKKIAEINQNPPKMSNQKFVLENLIDSVNESFKSQAETLGGESSIKIYNNLSYAHGDSIQRDIEGICAVYNKPTDSPDPLKVYPDFSFPKDFLINSNYKGKDLRDFSVFNKEYKISCDVEHTKNTKRICCVYYDNGDPIAK